MTNAVEPLSRNEEVDLAWRVLRFGWNQGRG